MNPYLEQETTWQDFHQSFMPVAREMISPQVLPRYFVKVDEHVYIHDLRENGRTFLGRADLALAESRPGEGPGSRPAVLESPAEVGVPEVDTERFPYLEVRDRESRELVTVIELLSPSNKRPGPDRDQYIAKCRQLLCSPANVVEIDLLRGGRRMPWDGMPPCDYVVVVSRSDRRPRAEAWPLTLRDRLPVIPVPLRPGEADASLDLQAVLDRIYEAAGYGYYVYEGRPEPPLSAADTAWASQYLPR